ncbi:TPA: ArsA-related P-loop ATPase, partial [Photobacterium damselae]
MSNIHFFLQGKGGVGKTLISSFTAQYLKEISNDVECIDTDSVNHTFSQYKSFNAKE